MARVPSRNTSYAHRTSGPGINRDFYNSLESEHLSMLVIAEVERIELRQIQQELTQILLFPGEHIRKESRRLLHNFSISNGESVYVRESTKNVPYLLSSLRQCVNKRMNKLPFIKGGGHTVRFTKESLNQNLAIVENIISEYIEEKDMDSYIWKQHGLRKGLLKRLSRQIFQKILSKNALESVENIDQVQKVNYSKSKMSAYVKNVVKSESLSFSKRKKKMQERIQNLRMNLNTKQYRFVELCAIGSFYSNSPETYEHPFHFAPMKKSQLGDWKLNEEKH
jgi:hypothetical protein